MNLASLGTLKFMHGKTKKFINRHIQIPVRFDSHFMELFGAKENDSLVLHAIFRGIRWCYIENNTYSFFPDREACICINKARPFINGVKHSLKFPSLYKMEWSVRFREIAVSNSKVFEFLKYKMLDSGQ